MKKILPGEKKATSHNISVNGSVTSDMDNYRPISILPVLSKILEGAVHRQLYHHLQQHNILSAYQCGFRKCHSTEFAAVSFADTIRRGIDQGQLICEKHLIL